MERFALPMWISAELSDLKVNGSGHCYLELVEKGESDGVAKAQARGVIWRAAYGAIAAKFEAATGARLTRGIKILAKVLVTYHELYGMSLQITDIDPTYTIGEVERQRQEAITRLKAHGSWDVNRGVVMPTLVQRVAVVSSAQAAGYQDFMREMGVSPYHIATTLFEAIMQGVTAEESIIAALIEIANRRDEFDAVVVIRGGGSTNDLRCFDSYRLALHFARFPRPVIAGIGHDKDTSVVDMVVHTSLKTPTAVAGWFYERMLSLDGWLQGAAQELHRATLEQTQGEKVVLEGYMMQIKTRCEEQINREKRELVDRLLGLPDLAYGIIAMSRKELDHASTVVEGYSPQRLMELGFALVRGCDSRKRVLSSAREVEVGARVRVEFADGEIMTEVKEIDIWSKR